VLRGPDGQPKPVRAFLQAGGWGANDQENAAIRVEAEEKGIKLFEVNGPGLNTISGCNPPRPDDAEQAAKYPDRAKRTQSVPVAAGGVPADPPGPSAA
jgi:hypothetical protein